MNNKKRPLTLFWFRRDLRLHDNAGFYEALKGSGCVQPVFIFDQSILKKLRAEDQRVPFIHQTIQDLKAELKQYKSDLLVDYGDPLDVLQKWIHQFQNEQKVNVKSIYTNHDYEPSAILRDQKVEKWCQSNGIEFKTFKDQTIFEKNEIRTDQGKPYTVYTPYKKKWLATVNDFYLKSYPNKNYFHELHKTNTSSVIPSLSSMGFKENSLLVDIPTVDVSKKILSEYAEKRDFPFYEKATSRLGLHLRFGTVSVRELAREGKKHSDVWLSELIWRDFFMQVLWNYPHVEKSSFRPQFEKVQWRESKDEFKRWCDGQTGYPLVDAGMRELNETGHMHNRVRMVVASFLTKHLLMHWYQGERYFADLLLDYDLAANNGNWQWAAGTGCDAAPYFRVFNPQTQLERFDPDLKYVKKWVPEFGTAKSIKPMVEHTFARNRALETFKKALK